MDLAILVIEWKNQGLQLLLFKRQLNHPRGLVLLYFLAKNHPMPVHWQRLELFELQILHFKVQLFLQS